MTYMTDYLLPGNKLSDEVGAVSMMNICQIMILLLTELVESIYDFFSFQY